MYTLMKTAVRYLDFSFVSPLCMFPSKQWLPAKGKKCFAHHPLSLAQPQEIKLKLKATEKRMPCLQTFFLKDKQTTKFRAACKNLHLPVLL